MTINELIQKLMEYGDEKSRDMATVRIVNSDGGVVADQISAFDVKFGIKSVDIPLEVQIQQGEDDWDDALYDGDDGDEYWEDDDEDDEEDDGDGDGENYGWDDAPPKP